MSKKLDSVRRSLFQEFDDSAQDDSCEKLGNLSHQKASSKRTTSININSTAIAVVVILSVAIAALSKFHPNVSNDSYVWFWFICFYSVNLICWLVLFSVNVWVTTENEKSNWILILQLRNEWCKWRVCVCEAMNNFVVFKCSLFVLVIISLTYSMRIRMSDRRAGGREREKRAQCKK